MLDSDEHYDAYVVFDADNIAHPDYIKNMNKAYGQGHRIAQGFRDSKNPVDSVDAGASAIFFWFNSRFCYLSRSHLRLSAFINGTGFMVADSVLRDANWRTGCITEDIEFTSQCLSNGQKIGFAADAIVYDEQPIDFATSWRQRRRWSIGMMNCWLTYSGRLLKRAFTKRDIASFDFWLYISAPVIQILMVVYMALVLASWFVQLAGGTIGWGRLAVYFVVSLLAWLLSPLAIGLLTVVRNRKKLTRMWRAVVYFPVFFVTASILNIMAVFTTQGAWRQIEHVRPMSFADICLAGVDR